MDLPAFRARFYRLADEARVNLGRMEDIISSSRDAVSGSREKMGQTRALLKSLEGDMQYRDRAQALLDKAAKAEEQANAYPEMKMMWMEMAESCRELAALLLKLENEKNHRAQ